MRSISFLKFAHSAILSTVGSLFFHLGFSTIAAVMDFNSLFKHLYFCYFLTEFWEYFDLLGILDLLKQIYF